MATSGSFDTNQYSNRGLTFSWSRTNYDIAGNYSDISWELKGNGSKSGYYMAGAFTVVIDGETVYSSSDRIQLWNGTVVKTGTKRIYHNNDGTRSFSASASAGIYTYAVNVSGSGSWSLDTIPRAPSYNSINASSITETSVRLTASIDTKSLGITDGGWDLSTDGGATWTYHSGGVTDKTISGLSPNTTYWYRGYAVTQGGGANSGWGSFKTYDYPKPTSVSSNNIGDAFTVKVDNPLGRTYKLELISNEDSSILNTYNGSINGNVTGFNDSATIDKFYKTIPNKNSGTYYAKITYSGNTRTKGNGTYTTKQVECSPSFSNFNYKDSNTDIVAITGNDQVFVKGYSKLYITIPSANKMTTQKYATPNKYVIGCDTLNKDVNYSSSDINTEVGTIVNSGTLRVNARAYDSRSNSALAYKDITVYDYAKPVINVSASRLNKFENQTTIKVSGTYTKLTINDTNKNTITNVKYRYRETGGTWSNWTNISTTVSNGTFTCSDVILSLDNTKSFEFEIQATDRIDSNTKTANVDIGQAIFFISSNNRACYINGQEILQYDVVDTW